MTLQSKIRVVRERSHKIPFCHFTYQRMQSSALFCLYTFISFPTLFNEVGEELGDTCLAVVLFTLVAV